MIGGKGKGLNYLVVSSMHYIGEGEETTHVEVDFVQRVIKHTLLYEKGTPTKNIALSSFTLTYFSMTLILLSNKWLGFESPLQSMNLTTKPSSVFLMREAKTIDRYCCHLWIQNFLVSL